MKTQKENIDLIERYLDDKLSPDELDLFRKKLNSDHEFNKLFFEMDRLVEGIKISAGKTSIEEKLANLERTLPFQKSKKEEEETPVIILWDYVKQYKLAVAAVFTILFAATVVFIPFNNSTDPSKLFDKYYNPYENLGTDQKRSGELTEDAKMFEKAMIFYDNGEYDKAIEIFNSDELGEKEKVLKWMYNGNAHLSTGKTEKAKELFDNIIIENSGLVIQAKWYLSLTYLKEGDVEQAKSLLKEISSKESSLKGNASKLLVRLDRLKVK